MVEGPSLLSSFFFRVDGQVAVDAAFSTRQGLECSGEHRRKARVWCNLAVGLTLVPQMSMEPIVTYGTHGTWDLWNMEPMELPEDFLSAAWAWGCAAVQPARGCTSLLSGALGAQWASYVEAQVEWHPIASFQ